MSLIITGPAPVYSLGELGAVENKSGNPDAVAVNAAVNATGCVITVPATLTPGWVHGSLTLSQASVGTGAVNLSIVDYTHGAFVESVWIPLPNTAGRQFSGRVSYRFDSLAVDTTFGLLVGNNADANQTATLSILNQPVSPSRLWVLST